MIACMFRLTFVDISADLHILGIVALCVIDTCSFYRLYIGLSHYLCHNLVCAYFDHYSDCIYIYSNFQSWLS